MERNIRSGTAIGADAGIVTKRRYRQRNRTANNGGAVMRQLTQAKQSGLVPIFVPQAWLPQIVATASKLTL